MAPAELIEEQQLTSTDNDVLATVDTTVIDTKTANGANTCLNGIITKGCGDTYRVCVSHRVLRTCALISAFFMVGATQAILGPSLVSMGILLNEETSRISTSMTAQSIGYLSGALLCGAIYDLMNRELLFLVGSLLLGVVTAVAPSGGHLYLYIAALAVQGFFAGVVDTAGQAYIIYLWRRHRLQWIMMLTLHFTWAAGSATGPFMIRSFLVDIHRHQLLNLTNYPANCTHELAVSTPIHTLYQTRKDISGYDLFHHDNSSDFTNTSSLHISSTAYEELLHIQDRVSVIRYGFILVGSLSVLPFLLFTTAFHLLGPSVKFKEVLVSRHINQNIGDVRERTQPKNVAVLLVLFMALLFFMYSFVNTNNGAFLATFTVKGLDWPNNYGALVTSLYFGSSCIGKVLLIYPVLHLKPSTLNVILMSTVLGGCALMLISYWHFSVVWVSAAIMGLSMSCINTACFFWVNAYLAITGRFSSVVMATGSVGAMTGPVLCGYLFDKFGPMTFVYTVLTGCTLQLLIFIGAIGFSSKYSKKVLSTEITIETSAIFLHKEINCSEKL